MGDIRKGGELPERDRAEAMKTLRAAMRQKNECLEDQAHCDSARKAIIESMRPVIALDPPYFKTFFKEHQSFAASFNDYKYVEELCVVVCAIEGWTNGPPANIDVENDPYAAIAWIGGLDLHLHASMYFGFTRKEMLRCFQIVQEMKEAQIDALTDPDYSFPKLELADSEAWMLYFTAATCLKFKEGVAGVDALRGEMGIGDKLRLDIIGAIKSTYWWRYMLMSRAIQPAADGLPPEIKALV